MFNPSNKSCHMKYVKHINNEQSQTAHEMNMCRLSDPRKISKNSKMLHSTQNADKKVKVWIK